jgi:hypothetical protein
LAAGGPRMATIENFAFYALVIAAIGFLGFVSAVT